MKICPCCGFVEIPAKSRSAKKVKADEILQTVCEYFNLSINAVKSNLRHSQFVTARMYAAKLMLENGMTLKDAGDKLGGRDHTTIIYYKKLYSDLEFCKSETKKHYTTLKNMIYG